MLVKVGSKFGLCGDLDDRVAGVPRDSIVSPQRMPTGWDNDIAGERVVADESVTAVYETAPLTLDELLSWLERVEPTTLVN